ncbi:Gfo/Idh/MocA family protein [Streptomyces sp. NPDC033754]|uniref:Gfo/Idh/MocA family protein n=1 Tax=unclassified Streptomyces TaxID=2593676 RepID=UPI0033C409D6
MRNVEDVLVVGYGYAGRRFATALRHLAGEGFPVRIVGVCDREGHRLPDGETGFTDLTEALRVLRPSVVCVTVNETQHASVYRTLSAYGRALVLSEKPLTADAEDGARAVADLAGHGFSMNLVERFSPVVRECARWLDEQGPFELLRVETFWGKHRIGDARPTMGVLSELIHPLDLIHRLFPGRPLDVLHAQGVASDLDVSSAATLDSLDVTARMGGAPVLLHSSYAWPKRVRTVSALLRSERSGMHRVNLVFDTPHWDCDSLEIVAIAPDGHYRVVHGMETRAADVPAPIRGVAKVVEYLRCSIRHWRAGGPEATGTELVGLETAMDLQTTLARMAAAADPRLVQAQYRGITVGA